MHVDLNSIKRPRLNGDSSNPLAAWQRKFSLPIFANKHVDLPKTLNLTMSTLLPSSSTPLLTANCIGSEEKHCFLMDPPLEEDKLLVEVVVELLVEVATRSLQAVGDSALLEEDVAKWQLPLEEDMVP